MAKTAWINLSTGVIRVEETDPELLQQYLGGRGLGAKYLYDLVRPGVDPFGPENYLIFTNGLFSGTPWPSASRYHVTFKSPATDGYGYANSGGGFGPELAIAGYDALVFSGISSTPVYLKITDESISLENAEHLWGKRTGEVQDILLGAGTPTGANGRVSCIGPAGENLVRIASIINDYGRAAARGGPGAVMGSKNLKAVHVKASSKGQSSAKLHEEIKRLNQHLRKDPKMQGLIDTGTVFLMRIKNISGDLPAKNHQLGQVPFIDKVDGTALKEYRTKRMGCGFCPVQCSCESVGQGSEGLIHTEGPEYETTDALGPVVWNDDVDVIIEGNYLCNELGLDTISTGKVIGFAMECHEKGILSDADFSLEWGDSCTILGLMKSISYRKGIGDLLAEGTKRAAEKIGHGADAYAMHVKGLEIPEQEPRVSKGFGLGHAVANRGADHLYGLPAIDLGGNFETAKKIFPAEIIDELMETYNEKYKADMLIYGEHFCALSDAFGVCKFTTTEEYSLLPSDFLPGLKILGYDLDDKSLLKIGERIVNLERLFNIREGFDRKDDNLPKRFTTEVMPIFTNERDPETGKTTLGKQIGSAIIQDLDAMLDRYYLLRNWDQQGKPTPEKLLELGILQEDERITS
ncbi:MAG: aldehyde ferredoxin oxidoreductase [Chloroflexi bacterium HGW-Chloroflexi-3]|nr:MAG: aldehyde ferredoxin oxidoreductase [Chloroflexi bacterium HGW-Chloroflexi-3]